MVWLESSVIHELQLCRVYVITMLPYGKTYLMLVYTITRWAFLGWPGATNHGSRLK